VTSTRKIPAPPTRVRPSRLVAAPMPVKKIVSGLALDLERRDDHQQRRIDRTSAETLTLLETLMSCAPVGFGFVDRDFRMQRLNERLAAVNGSTVADQLGRKVCDITPELWPTIEPAYRQVLTTGEAIVNFEISGPSAESPGRRRHWLDSWYPVRIEDEIVGIGIVVVDVTERHEAEAAHMELTHAAVSAIGATVEVRDPYTSGHQDRVADMSAAIARELGLDTFTVEGIHLAASIHDIGKIAVPSEILNKTGSLRPAEFELIKNHSQIGHDIIAGIAFPWPVADMILQHHERFDGSGYPGGLRGDEITIGARIVAVADVFEAMSSHRPYRASRGPDAALQEIRRGRGTSYDPSVVDAFLSLVADGRIASAEAGLATA
jgi:PAS domain S-box-containing protein